ncbi:uncharacterized protein LOC124997234 [Mugil cephalus]|uniref:uncharacterized protein LOC124997234 n=1 Tax=Mugil cephalus TaxID=48193 RepID=UPI001FB6B95F|nr:uncharacterized protein LOC124997234 [Mugil cephalus]
MALSQLWCLDDNHVNPRTHESKAEFFYCEEQRLALETLLRDGREAFIKHLEARALRGFLSDPELEALSGSVEPYDPGSDLFPENEGAGEGEAAPLSLHYWPDLSDTSIPQMDLGWPDSEKYRGVTRTTVYTQPPLEGQVHIKEVVRKMIAQAQKVIAVVMDIFTDVDIFRDLIDAGFKRRVSVYILLERTTLPHFLSMCQRANMHAGHLKHLRVRCTEGTVFHTRSCTKVKGRMGHRFMFIDGDKAVSGSYSFTWTSSRLDRNLITVITGQAADGFDRLFRVLYASSSSVDLRQVSMDPEPQLEPPPQPVVVPPPSAAVARKLYNPKYSLVTVSNPSPAAPAERDSPKEPEVSDNSKKKKRGKASQEPAQDEPPLHPGLVGLEKASLIAYLPTWPEPDPPSDVIGFINIRDANRPTQVHLQRSEMFETSQAIRFSSPFSKAQETSPEVTKPGPVTSKPEESNKGETKVEEPTKLNEPPQNEAPEQKSPTSGEESEPEKDPAVNTDHELCPNHDGGHETPKLSAQTPAPNKTETSQTVSSNGPTSESDTKQEEEPVSNLNTQSAATHKTHILDSHTTQTSKHEKTDSQTEISPVVHGNVSTSSASQSVVSETSHINGSTSSSTPIHALTSASPEINRSISSSSSSSGLNSAPPVPKPRTVQLIIKDNNNSSDGQNFPVISIVKRSESSVAPLVVHDESFTETSAVKEPETVPELEDSSDKKTGEETLQRQESSTSQEIESEEGDRRQDGAELRTQTVVDGAKSASVDIQEIEPEDTNTLKKIKNLTEMAENGQEASEQKKVCELESDYEGTKSEEAKSSSVNIQEIKPEDPTTLKEIKYLTETDKNGKESSERQRFDGGKSTNEGTKSEEIDGDELQTHSNIFTADASESASVNIQEIIPEDPKTELVEKGRESLERQRMANHVAPDGPINGESTNEGAKSEEADEAKVQTRSDAFITDAPKSNGVNIQEILPNSTDLNCETTPETETERHQTTGHEAPDVTSCKSYLARAHEPQIISYNSPTPQETVDALEAVDSLQSAADTHSKQVRSPNNANTFQEQIPKVRGSIHTPEKSLRLHLSEMLIPDLRSPTAERSLRSLVRSPTPDGFSPHTPTQDFRTLTPDISDGYKSPRQGSTTSEEYYECIESPLGEPLFELGCFHSHGTVDDHVGFKHTNAAYNSYSSGAAKSDLSSILRLKITETNNTANDSSLDEDGPWKKRESQILREADGIVNKMKDSTETAGKGKQAPKRKRGLHDFIDGLVDGGATEGANEATEAKRLSVGKMEEVVLSGESRDEVKEKPLNEATLRVSGGERRESTRETETQKVSFLQPQRVQLQEGGAPPLSQPSTPPRPASAPQPVGNLQTQSKVPNDNTASPRKPPSRPPPPEILLAQQSKARPGQNQTSTTETHGRTDEGKVPFRLSFSRLYSLRGLRDRMSKSPSQSKRGTSSQVQRRKSTS